MVQLDRRSFIGKAGLVACVVGSIGKAQNRPVPPRKSPEKAALPSARFAVEHCVTEWAYASGKTYRDPFNDVELDVIFRDPQGAEQRVPAFWAGDQVWRVRFAPSCPGRYSFHTVSSDPANPDLHGQTGVLDVSPYTGENPLLKHGGVRIASDRRHFEHADGTPFFWLGDTWWMGLCRRLRWPEDFQKLATDRAEKGFTVIQIIAGLYPDMPPFDARGENEAGYSWEENYRRINPGYFNMADLRIQELVDRGLVPCIVGCWGYFLTFLGLGKIKQHWRNIVARWGAYPVVWCLAGEGTMPYYLSKTKDEDTARQKSGWTEVARYVRSIDPYRRPITVHPSSTARDSVEDPTTIDFDMLQTGHSDRKSYPNTINKVTEELSRSPQMPVLVGEACYEGILDENREEVSRFLFWSCILSGAAGHTYGADGIWQVNTVDQPFGRSPHGRSWGGPSWETAAGLPGSRQVGLGKRMLAHYSWWRMEPHPEWVEPHWNQENYELPYAAGIAREWRVIFVPPAWDPPMVRSLEPDVRYQALFFNPRSGTDQLIGDVVPDREGNWRSPLLPTFEQWVLLLTKKA